MTLTACYIAAFILWLIIFLLPWRPWAVKETLEAEAAPGRSVAAGAGLTVLIPARNEEKNIADAIKAVLAQKVDATIIVVDDCSMDNTAAIAREAIGSSGKVIQGHPVPDGWSGKLWALQQGLAHAGSGHLLLMDADILLKPGIIATALEFMEKNHLDFLSLMARLRMKALPERFFMPAFVYFFKLIYPFRLSNRPGNPVAAAAGGFILTTREVLEKVKAFESIKDALIDDCTLAARVKSAGFRTWIGLTRSVVSMRPYNNIRDIWHMVERTAFTQLRHSFLLLALVTALMALLFIVPLYGLFAADMVTAVPALASLSIMCITYLPVLNYYGMPRLFCISLPAVAMMYMLMTWSSAMKYYTGQGSGWKGRQYF